MYTRHTQMKQLVSTLTARLGHALVRWALAPERIGDEALMEAGVQGDEDAFQELFARYELELLRFCFGYMQRADLARELAREVVACARGRAKEFNHDVAFKSWLFSLARHRCVIAILDDHPLADMA